MKQRSLPAGNCRATAPVAGGRRSTRPAKACESNRPISAVKNIPTFVMLREKRRLAVCNPENGARFTISLRNWQEMLWAVRVQPEPRWRQRGNAYTTAHRIMPRTRIEDWVSELQLC